MNTDRSPFRSIEHRVALCAGGRSTDNRRPARFWKGLPNLVLFVGAAWVLATGFGSNRWGVVEPHWFATHQLSTEAHVIGRLVQSRHAGLWSFAGFNGVGVNVPPRSNRERPWPRSKAVAAQTTAYHNGTAFPAYDPYISQSGGQGWLFSLADAWLPMTSERKLEIFHGFTAWMTALVLAGIVLWLKLRLGWIAALCALASMVFSPWLVVFGKNLWWSLWTFYLPLAALAALLWTRPPARVKGWTLGVVTLGAVFTKCLLTGFEYMTTTLLMAAVPVVFSLCLDWPGWRRGATVLAAFTAGSVGAVLLAMLVLCVQIGALRGRPSAGIEHLRFSLAKRTWDDPQKYPERARQYQTPLSTVLGKYQRGICYDLSAAGRDLDRPRPAFFRPFRFQQLIVALVVPTLLVLGAAGTRRGKPYRPLILAAVVSTWFSLAAPYSWFIIFKLHSIVHYHMNYVCWHMPFTFMAAALFGFALSLCLRLMVSRPLKESNP